MQMKTLLSKLQNLKHWDKIGHCIGAFPMWLIPALTIPDYGHLIGSAIAIAFYYGREQAQAEVKYSVVRVSPSGLKIRSLKDELKSYFFPFWSRDAMWDVLVVVIMISLLNILMEIYNAT